LFVRSRTVRRESPAALPPPVAGELVSRMERADPHEPGLAGGHVHAVISSGGPKSTIRARAQENRPPDMILRREPESRRSAPRED